MEKEKAKVLFVSDLVAETGFSTVSHNIIKHNLEHFEITGLGVNYNGDPHKYEFPIYPAMSRGTGNIYGLDRLCQLLMTNDFDLVYILNDAFVIGYYLDVIKKNIPAEKIPPIVVYFPVDSAHHNPVWYKDFDIVTKAFTYTEYGKKIVSYCAPKVELGIIPHGVEANDFYKIYEDSAEAKAKMFHGKLKYEGQMKDLFIVLNANRNQPRKRLDITVEGFSLFAYNKPENVRLYMHCGVRDSSIDVVNLTQRYGVNDRLIVTNLNSGIQRLSVDKLNLIYNACDVGINTSMGEGWGLTNVEHAVTGAVQIVPRHSACEELFSDCGLLMENITNYTFDNSNTVGKLTTPAEVARCLEILYRDVQLRKELSEKGMKKFLDKKYSWKAIAEQWREIFFEVCKKDATSIS